MCTVGQDGEFHENGQVARLIKRYGVNEIELNKAYAGDIISVAGF